FLVQLQQVIHPAFRSRLRGRNLLFRFLSEHRFLALQAGFPFPQGLVFHLQPRVLFDQFHDLLFQCAKLLIKLADLLFHPNHTVQHFLLVHASTSIPKKFRISHGSLPPDVPRCAPNRSIGPAPSVPADRGAPPFLPLPGCEPASPHRASGASLPHKVHFHISDSTSIVRTVRKSSLG